MLLHKFVSTVQISLILLLMPLKRLKTVKKVPMAKMLLSLKSSETKMMIVMILLSLKAEKKLMMNPLSLKTILSVLSPVLDYLVEAAVQLFKKISKAPETKVSKVQLFVPKTLLSETKAQKKVKAKKALMMSPLRLVVVELASE